MENPLLTISTQSCIFSPRLHLTQLVPGFTRFTTGKIWSGSWLRCATSKRNTEEPRGTTGQWTVHPWLLSKHSLEWKNELWIAFPIPHSYQNGFDQCFIPDGKGKTPYNILHSSCTEASQDVQICPFMTSQKILQRQQKP